MNRFVRNLVIRALIAMTMVIVFSVGFAFLTGNIGTADYTSGVSTTGNSDSNNTASAEPEPIDDITDKEDPPKPESILQTIELPPPKATPEIHKVDHIQERPTKPTPKIDKPNYLTAHSGTIQKLSNDFVINGQIRLSMVESDGSDAGYSKIHQACPIGTTFVYHPESGPIVEGGIINAKVWCLHGSPDEDEPFETWIAPGGLVSVNEWLNYKK